MISLSCQKIQKEQPDAIESGGKKDPFETSVAPRGINDSRWCNITWMICDLYIPLTNMQLH